MSGDEKRTLRYLETGKTLDETVSSWVYHPGFRLDDDPEIAVLWEREPGIFLNGQRADGHAVALVGGGYEQISSKDWPAFLKRQEELRERTLAKRPSQGRAQPAK